MKWGTLGSFFAFLDHAKSIRKIDATRIEGTLSLHTSVLDMLGYFKDKKNKSWSLGNGWYRKSLKIMQNLNNIEQIAKIFNIFIWIALFQRS